VTGPMGEDATMADDCPVCGRVLGEHELLEFKDHMDQLKEDE